MKKIFKLISILILTIVLTGCKSDTMEDITIYTTVYPIEYITSRLYGDYSEIYSIYPDGVNVNEYTLTKKQIKDYSDSELLIFNGLDNEKDYVIKFFKHNKRIKIIDATNSMEIDNRTEELWLNPSNFLMLAQNIKNGFDEYVSNNYIKNTIEENFKELKIDVSNIDATLTHSYETATTKNLIIANKALYFLEKYGYNIICLDDENISEKTIADAKDLLNNGNSKTIFALDNDEVEDSLKELLGLDKVDITYLHSLSNITEDERTNKDNYITIMNENIDILKTETHK